MDQLRAGAAPVTDDAAQGRGASLAASLDYGFTHAFTDPERATLALLALFQGFIDIDALRAMGDPAMPGGPVPAVAGLNREAGDRAAGPGRRNRPAHRLRRRLLRRPPRHPLAPAHPLHRSTTAPPTAPPPSTPPAPGPPPSATSATTTTASTSRVTPRSSASSRPEEANLLHARRLALTHGWHDLVIGPMQGLRVLYEHTGRAVEWRRLVDELVPEFTDPATGGPRPGREEQWAILTSYRVRIARDARDWPAARQLQDAVIAWHRQQAAAALDHPPGELNDRQRNQIRNLAVGHRATSARSCASKTTPAACSPTTKPSNCSSGSATGAGKPPSRSTSGTPTKTSPPCATSTRPSTGTSATSNCSKSTTPSAAHGPLGQLGNVAYERFNDARAAGAPDEQLLRHLNDAASAYHQALDLLPDNAVGDLAVDPPCRSATSTVTPGTSTTRSGTTSRPSTTASVRTTATAPGGPGYDAALTLADAGRHHDALLYARAALRDFEAVGPGAAARADQARQLITALEQEPPHEHNTGTGGAT